MTGPLRKTVTRSSSRGPNEVHPCISVRMPPQHMAALKGKASLAGVSVQEVIRKAIERELAR